MLGCDWVRDIKYTLENPALKGLRNSGEGLMETANGEQTVSNEEEKKGNPCGEHRGRILSDVWGRSRRAKQKNIMGQNHLNRRFGVLRQHVGCPEIVPN